MKKLENKSFFETEKYRLKVLNYLGKGKSGYSYLTAENNTKCVLKLMHGEECSYYNFSKSKVDLELEAYSVLCNHNIPIPKLFEWNIEKQYLVKEYIEGKLAPKLIAENNIDLSTIKQLFTISNKVSKAGLNIDYFPNNFVIKGEKLFYIDYEVNEYDEKWNLDNWGLYYWLNSSGYKRFLETGDAGFINSDLEKGIPIKKPFQDTVDQLVKKYSNNK